MSPYSNDLIYDSDTDLNILNDLSKGLTDIVKCKGVRYGLSGSTRRRDRRKTYQTLK